MTPTLKFSTTTSLMAMMRRVTSLPSSDLRLAVIDSLFRLWSAKGSDASTSLFPSRMRQVSGRARDSILTTSAPK